MRSIKNIAVAVGVLFLGVFVVVVFNQVMQVYLYASAVDATFGRVVAVVLTLVFAGLCLVPAALFMRLPKPLAPPRSEADLPAYLPRLGGRLAANRRLSGTAYDFSQREDMQRALAVLDTQADAVIRRTARNVFLATSISQNGKLDALMVLATHTRMIWDIAHVYYQRPALRDLVGLYANVGATTLLATQLEDLDISEQMEPVLGTVLQGSALRSVPFVGPLSSVILDSLLEGSINAFLTLRVGIIAKRHCGTLEPFVPGKVRRAALLEASSMLKGLVVETSGQVVRSVVKAARKAGTDTMRTGVERAGRATATVKDGFFGWFRRSPTA